MGDLKKFNCVDCRYHICDNKCTIKTTTCDGRCKLKLKHSKCSNSANKCLEFKYEKIDIPIG